MKKINIGLIGAGGYASSHLARLRKYSEKGLCNFKAAVIRHPERRNYAEIEKELKSEGIYIYRSYEELYKEQKGKIDLIIIPCSIDQHEELSIHALENGFHVFCEKPVCGTIKEALNMKNAKNRTGNLLIIGYQNIFSPSIQEIKKIRLNKDLGDLIRIKTMAAWPRSSAYYNRNYWAGKLEVNGKKIFDSPAQNALSHYLNNMLYIAGESQNESALPIEIYGGNYRAKDIESADTQYMHIKTLNNIEIYFMVTHACIKELHPITEFVFEKGRIIWSFEGNGRTRIFNEVGNKKEELDNGSIDIHENMYNSMIQSVLNKTPALCNIDNAYQHTICINKSFESSNGIHDIPAEFTDRIKVEKESYDPSLDVSDAYNIIIKDIEDTIEKMYKEECSFSELNCPFAVNGEKITSLSSP